jgi:hypothetical protein
MALRIDVFTQTQYAMLVEANGCSLPGDGLRIKGAGQHRVARALEDMGFVRVDGRPFAAHGEAKARVHITKSGRKRREQIAATLLKGTSS